MLDEDIRFLMPHGSGRPGKHLAIFTDEALALECLEHCGAVAEQLELISIPSAEDLRRLLVCGQHAFERVWIDLNPKTRIGRNWSAEELISELDRILGQQERKEGQ